MPRLYEDLHVLHQNTIPDHCYFIPVSPQAGDGPPLIREESDRIQMLSGREWNFRYFRSIHEAKEEFYREEYRCDETWKRERVPFCWQMREYDCHQYTNIRYPFPFDPPYVPQDNPCGEYLHSFFWHRDPEAPCVSLHFEGVDSCFYVWLNGAYVGYSQITHHTSEFDVTGYLREGENTLAVLVLKWCDGSYLEDQDKFRMSGIIRDVYLLNRPLRHVTDYVIRTILSEDLREGKLEIGFCTNEGAFPVTAQLLYESECAAEAEGRAPGTILFTVKNPRLWNAETPELYTLVLRTEQEVIRERVGFRRIYVRDGVVILNGARVIFRGVNRHESDPVTGETVTREQVLRDLRMIKEHNFNAVRASHYPNVPYFYQLCDEIGLYVVDEADNESHGTAPLHFTEEDYAERMRLAHRWIADNPDFAEATLDRVRSMVLRNRNRPSILVWSMGNECGYGCTFEQVLAWTKKTDPTRLTHYESAWYLPRDRKNDVSGIDLVGRMYPALEEITEYMNESPRKPLLLVEYCHSMGNSPGDFLEYREYIEKYPRLCGGFVWEWCDHAVYKGKTADGRDRYWYGGDHGELQHDGNFCLDGLVYPDRRPHTGLLEYKNVHRPLRAAYDAAAGQLTVENHWDFLSPGGHAEAVWQLTLDGTAVDRGRIALPEIAPHTRGILPLSLRIPEKGRCFLLVEYAVTEPLAGLPAGHILGFDEIRIHTASEKHPRVRQWFPEEAFCEAETKRRTAAGRIPDATEKGTDLHIRGEAFHYVLDTRSGCFTSWRVGGREFLKRPLDFNLWRAPTDNDAGEASLWRWERLDCTVTRAYEVHPVKEQDSLCLELRQSVAAVSVPPILTIRSEIRIYPDGTIRMYVCAGKYREIRTLPRIGLRMFLDSALQEAEYYGIGPRESYIDKCRSGFHGCFRAAVTSLHEDYIRPQENGSHCDCDYVRLSGEGMALTAAAADTHTFSFQASVYTQEELESKRHNYELVPCGDTVLCLDHRMAGIGSKSCGPDLQEKYRVDEDIYTFAFLIKPEVIV